MLSHPRLKEAKEEIRPETTPEAPSGKVLTTYAECLYFARSAYKAVKQKLPLGADSNYPADECGEAFQKAFQAIAKVEQVLEFDCYHNDLSPWHRNFRERFILSQKCLADVHTEYKAGNCTAHAAVAFTYLWQCNVRPISHAMIGDLLFANGHAFIIVGDINKPHVAMVCDPYNNECYPLYQFNNHKAAARGRNTYKGDKIVISYTSGTEDHSNEIKEVFGHQVNLPDSIDKEIDDFFTQKFLTACKKVLPVWADSPVNTAENTPPTIVQPNLPTIVQVPQDHIERGYWGRKR